MTTNGNLTLIGSVTDAVSGVADLEAAFDGGSFAAVTLDGQGHFSLPTSLSLSGSADGAHTVRLKATDKVGNVSPAASFSFTLDTQAPDITVTSPVDNLTTGVNVTVVGKVTDATSGVATLHAAVDNEAFSAVTLDAQGHFSLPTSLALDGSSDGPHTVYLKAIDNAGNVSAVIDDHFTLDTRNPVVNVTSPISGISVNNNIAVIGKVTDSQADLTTLQVAIDGGAYSSLAFDLSGNFSFTTALALNGTADGLHTLHFKAADMAGNASAVTDFPFTLDTAAPTIAVSSPASRLTTSTNITLAGSVSDATSGVAGLQAAVDGGAYSVVALNAQGQFSLPNSLALDGSADGAHTIHLKATDKAGNLSAVTDFPFTLDTLAPTIAISNPMSGLTTSTNITLAGSVSDATSGVAGLQAAIDGGAYSAVTLNAQGQFSLPTALALDGSADGAHTVHLKATDKAGNVSAATDFTLTLDTAAPTIAIASPASGQSVNQNVTIVGQATDAGSGLASLAVAVDAGAYTPVTVDGTGNFNYPTTFAVDGSADGPHTVHFQATDKAGNVSVANDFTLTLLTAPPTITAFDLSPGSQTGTPGSHTTDAARVTLVGQTEPGVQVTLVGTGRAALGSGSGAFTFPNVTLTAGDNTLTAQATDTAGNTATFPLTVHYTPPTGGQTDPVITWNQNALAAIRQDASDPNMASRALAMVQSAVYDAVNAAEQKPGHFVTIAAATDSSVQAAVNQAAHDVLAYLYPAQQATLDAELTSSLADVRDGQSKTDGITAGQQVAAAIIAMRAGDGWNNYVDYAPGSGPGVWVPTSPSYAQALEPQWATLTPWTMTSDSQFRPAGPPDLSSQAWADALNQVQSLGAANSTTRTADQTQIAHFWADTSGTATPPGHWNEIADQVASSAGNSLDENAQLFAELVGGGVAYIAVRQYDSTGSNGYVTLASGYTTVDVSNPDHPKATGALPPTSSAGQAIALNGSGIAVTVGSDANGPAVSLFDSSDPANVNQFLTRFSLPAAANGVAIGAGIAFVADGSAGLQVVNYLPFDTTGVAPTIKLDTSNLTPDAALGGFDAVEGSLLTLNATVSDDVQVRNVELLVNGQVAKNDVAFPFDLSTYLPTIATAGTSVIVQISATDTGGNTTTTDPITLNLVRDTTPPTIIQQNPPNGGLVGQQFRDVVIDFSKPLDATTISAADFELNGSAGTVPAQSVQLRVRNSEVQITFPAGVLPVGDYTLVIHASMITDTAGNALGTADVTSTFQVLPYTVFWMNPNGGKWNDPTSWSTGKVPGPNDAVLIDVSGNPTITYDSTSGVTEIGSLLCKDPFQITGGTFTADQSIEVDNTFTISGGTLKDTLVLPGSGGQGVTITSSGVTLDGVTMNANLALAGANGLTVKDGLTLNGTVTLGGSGGGNYGYLDFNGSQTLGGSGTVIFNGPDPYNSLAVSDGQPTTLTIGSGITIRGQGGYVGFTPVLGGAVANISIVNQGIIQADASGSTITVSAGTLAYTGTLGATNGTLQVNGLVSPTSGTIAAGAGGTVTVNGAFSIDPTGTANVELGGTNPGQFGQIKITGAATLAGTLNISLANGFQPASGDAFKIMTFASATGQFGTINGVSIPNNLVLAPTYDTTDLTLVAGAAQMADVSQAAAVAESQPPSPQPAPEARASITQAAADAWAVAGLDPRFVTLLRSVDVSVAHFGNDVLALTAGNRIILSDDAEGYGWFSDPNPAGSADFTATPNDHVLAALAGTSAAAHFDLFTVIEHELGHILGLSDQPTGDDLMAESLAPGVRRTPSAEDIDAEFNGTSS